MTPSKRYNEVKKGLSPLKAVMFPLLLIIVVSMIYIATTANIDRNQENLIILAGVLFVIIILFYEVLY